VFAVGGPGVAHALTQAGLLPVGVSELPDAPVAAVVQGLGIDVTWLELAEVGYQVQGGAMWVATNLDLMLPTSRGPAPGNGALVATVQSATTTKPHVVGKPAADLYELARNLLNTERTETLVCGDRLDTDIAGANAAGLDSLLVLTGASRLRDLAFVVPAARPTYVAANLAGLLQPGLRLHAAPDVSIDLTSDGVLDIPASGDRSRLLQSVVATTWAAVDAGRVVGDDTDWWLRLEEHLGLTGADH
jgi:ribonucleotide monophosphatase NagD (HAD superfamily)